MQLARRIRGDDSKHGLEGGVRGHNLKWQPCGQTHFKLFCVTYVILLMALGTGWHRVNTMVGG